MNIVEFLDEVGHTKLQFQILHQCIQNATAARGHTKVTFGTTEITPSDVINLQRVGVVVWMDKADFDRASAVALGGKT